MARAGVASVQGLLLAPTEDDKSRIFIQLRHQLTPGDVLTIVQHERSESIAALAVGVYLEQLTVQPRAKRRRFCMRWRNIPD